MEETRKLFRVVLRGFFAHTTGVDYKTSYVVALDSSEAYKTVRDWLKMKNIGFTEDRCLESIKLIAEEYEYTDTKTMLFL